MSIHLQVIIFYSVRIWKTGIWIDADSANKLWHRLHGIHDRTRISLSKPPVEARYLEEIGLLLQGYNQGERCIKLVTYSHRKKQEEL
jgi:hypothetical protein